jgi:hypothetical protein
LEAWVVLAALRKTFLSLRLMINRIRCKVEHLIFRKVIKRIYLKLWLTRPLDLPSIPRSNKLYLMTLREPLEQLVL